MRIDHLVYATDDLDRTVAAFTALTGVSPTRGGQHLGLGTRNELVSLGDGCYLEIIGPDTQQPAPTTARPFGIDDLTGTERLVLGGSFGPLTPMSRKRPDGVILAWQIAFPARTTRCGPSLPFLIDWLASEHPTRSLPLSLTLKTFHVGTPHSDDLNKLLSSIGSGVEPRLTVTNRDLPSLSAQIVGPKGDFLLR